MADEAHSQENSMAGRAKKFATQIAGVVTETTADKAGFVEWLIPLLSLLAQLPCFAPKSAAEQYQWIRDNRKQAITRLTGQMRDHQTDRVARLKRKEAATQVVEKLVSGGQAEYVRLHSEVTA